MKEALWRNKVTIAASFVELTAVFSLLTGLLLQAGVLATVGMFISLALDGELHSRRSVLWFRRPTAVSTWQWPE